MLKYCCSLLLSLVIGGSLSAQSVGSKNEEAIKLADAQLNAYNARDIEAFLKPYSDSVKVYMFPDKLLYKGKEIMRKEYDGMFKATPDLHCTLVNRITIGNKVIDRESVIFKKGVPPLDAVAIYTIDGGKIIEVVFMQ